MTERAAWTRPSIRTTRSRGRPTRPGPTLPAEVPCAWPAPLVSAVLGDDYAAGRDDHGRVYVCTLDTGEVSPAATDARCVVAGNRRTIGVMDIAGRVHVVRNDRGSWQPVPATQTPSPYLWDVAPATTPDGVRFYLAGALAYGEISAWRRSARAPIYRADKTARVDKIAISADGHTAAAVNSLGNLIVVDVAAQRVLAEKPALSPTGVAASRSIRFRADGPWFVTGEQSGRACLWRIDDDTCHTWLDGHTKGVVKAVFADDGTIFTSSHDGTVRFWRPTYDEPIEALRAELARYGSRP